MTHVHSTGIQNTRTNEKLRDLYCLRSTRYRDEFIYPHSIHRPSICITVLPTSISLFFLWIIKKLNIIAIMFDYTIHGHDGVIKWKHFPRYWPFVRGIHRSPVNSPHKGLWRGALMYSLVCAWMNAWVNDREAGDLRRYRAYYDVTVMLFAAASARAAEIPCCHVAEKAVLQIHATHKQHSQQLHTYLGRKCPGIPSRGMYGVAATK